jgi:hypothetical protein
MKFKDVADDWVASTLYLHFKLKEVIEDPASELETIEHAWKLPGRLIEVVAYHHDPIQVKNYSRDTSIINLQEKGEGFSPPIDEKIVQSIGLNSRDVSAVKKEIKDQFDQTAEVFLSLKLEII